MATSHTATATVTKPRFGALRRWWISFMLPVHDSDLTSEEWSVLHKRWIDAGGDPDDFGSLIERYVLDD